METMVAAFFQAYGDSHVVALGNLPMPQLADDAVRVQVHAAGLNPRDALVRSGFAKYSAATKALARAVVGSAFPKITGSDLSGTVLEVGRKVSGFARGDAVFGYVQTMDTGSAAEEVVVKASWLAHKPPELSHAEAAALPCAYLTALQALRATAGLQAGQRVLIYGASGGVGTAAVQLARHLGAHITAVTSRKNADFCLAQGADAVLCYDEEDVWAGPRAFDVFFQVFSTESLYGRAKGLIKPRGTFISLNPLPSLMLQGLLLKMTRAPQLKTVQVRVRAAALDEIGRLAAAKVVRPQLQVMALNQVAAAHALLDTGHTRGKLVLAVR